MRAENAIATGNPYQIQMIRNNSSCRCQRRWPRGDTRLRGMPFPRTPTALKGSIRSVWSVDGRSRDSFRHIDLSTPYLARIGGRFAPRDNVVGGSSRVAQCRLLVAGVNVNMMGSLESALNPKRNLVHFERNQFWENVDFAFHCGVRHSSAGDRSCEAARVAVRTGHGGIEGLGQTNQVGL